MPTPKQGYWLDGKRLVSVTTIIHPYSPGGSDALIGWAINLIWEEIAKRLPITSMEQIEDLKRLHIAARSRAGEIGTMAHEAIEWWAKGGTYAFVGEPEVVEPAKMAYGAFIKWSQRARFKITHTEVRLTSKKYGYGGTLDAAGFAPCLTDMELLLRTLLDWKTSNYVKETMVMQLAAYRQLWNENYPEDEILGDCNLVRFDKKTGMFVDHWFPSAMLDKAFVDFLHLKDVYHGIKEYRI